MCVWASACGFSVSGTGSVIIFLLCASLRATSTARSRVVAPLSAALACTNWRRFGVRNCACRLIGGALPALGGELFTGHCHVVLLCLVLVLWFCCPWVLLPIHGLIFLNAFVRLVWSCWRFAPFCCVLCFARLTAAASFRLLLAASSLWCGAPSAAASLRCVELLLRLPLRFEPFSLRRA